MLFYVALFVICLGVAAISVWAFRTLSERSEAGFRTLRRSSRNRSRARLAHLNSSLATAPSPWGWSPGSVKRASTRSFFEGKGHHHAVLNKPDRRASTHREQNGVDRMRKGHEGRTASATARNVLTGYKLNASETTDTSSWPYRDDNFYSSRLTTTSSGRLEKSSVAASHLERKAKKPWGW